LLTYDYETGNGSFVMSVNIYKKVIVLLAAMFIMPRIVMAEISTDGSLGVAMPLTGPDFAITSDLGQQVGTNLFHSFQVFNISASESATFSGPASVTNILGRITGGSASNIDGAINSTIEGANLYHNNPSGIIFA
jgi:filamentous hemagglutinin family protein